jgi:arylsulfatase A
MIRLLLTFLLFAGVSRLAAAERAPNFIVIFAYDLGYGDLGCYGHPTINTPNLDRMAREGMKFTDFYSAAEVCTPSRAGLMTGRYPIRSGMASDKRRVLFPNSGGGLPQSEITIAKALKAKEYATACVGKWHLGHLPQFLPTRHGFDSYFGIPYSNDMDRSPKAPKGRVPFNEPKSEYWDVPLMRDEVIVERSPDQHELVPRYTREALAFIEKNQSRPFFLYFAHSFPHVPLFASKRFAGKSARGLYGDVVEEVDWSVGEIMKALKRLKIDRETLVFFTSDNGPWLIFNDQGGSAGLLRGGKGSTWDGGMREPGIAWWPGTIRPARVEHSLASTLDLLPTFLSLAKLPPISDRVIDGRDLSPLLRGTGPVERDAYFYYRGETLFAVRQGQHKAHFKTQDGYGQARPEIHTPPLLNQLGIDPGEQWNVAGTSPMVIASIEDAVERHRKTLKPVVNQLEIPLPAE